MAQQNTAYEYDLLSPELRTDPQSGEIHVWCASLDQSQSNLLQLEETLSKDERTRARDFVFDLHRRRFIAGRGLLRKILGQYQGINPNRVGFCFGLQGKPALRNNRDSLQFNLSHSQELMLVALTRYSPIGVDLERVRPLADSDQIIERYFAPQEKATLRSLPSDERNAAFFRCWTLKEAYLKARGCGLGQALDGFEVSLEPGKPTKLLSIDGDARRAAKWSLYDLMPAAGYAAALAVEGHGWRLRFSWLDAN